MDLNQLYTEHQLLLMKAESASSPVVRRALEVTASHVAGRIGCMQRALGASAAWAWDVLAAPRTGSLATPERHLQGHAH